MEMFSPAFNSVYEEDKNSYGSDNESAEEEKFDIPNLCQSLHIGCNYYHDNITKSKPLNLKVSDREADKLYKFFKEKLKWPAEHCVI